MNERTPKVHTRFVLIEVSHAGNVGAVARAMKTMGFDGDAQTASGSLVLVRPRWANVLNKQETIERASGAVDVIRAARVVDTVAEALDGIEVACATAMTPRDFGPPTYAPRTALPLLAQGRLDELLSNKEQENAIFRRHVADFSSKTPHTAFLFGPERYGMSNEDVYRTHLCLSIPTNPAYGSLNLAAAVQLIAYEWRQALGGFSQPQRHATEPVLADLAQTQATLDHWQQTLVEIGFLDPQAPKKLMPRLTQLLLRAQLRDEEVHILRGIARAVSRLVTK